MVGAVIAAHGIRGEVKIRPLTEFPERLPQIKQFIVRAPDGTSETRTVATARVHHEVLLVRFRGVDDRNQAEALRGSEIRIPASQAVPLPEGRYYVHQILGLRVVTPEGEELGRVRQVIEGVSNDVYVAGPWMIPATHDAVLRLDPPAGVIVVRSRAYLEGEEVR